MFIELTSRNYNSKDNQYQIGPKVMMDFNSGWEIYDNGDSSATWVNNSLGMNRAVNETYVEIKQKLINAGLLVEELQEEE